MVPVFFQRLCICLTLLGSVSAGATVPKLAILPFRITGQPSSRLPQDKLPAWIGGATHFLFGATRNFPLQPLQDTQEALQTVGWQTDHVLNSKNAGIICREADVSHLLTGDIHFRTAGQMTLRMVSYSCSSGSVLKKSSETGSFSTIQTLLRNGLKATAPFATGAEAKTVPREAIDLALLIDTSGSMISDLPVIVSSLTALKEALPVGSRMGAVLPGENRVLPFTTDLEKILQALREVRPRGEVDIRQIVSNLFTVEKYGEWRGVRRLLVFTDAFTGGKRQTELETRLRRLKKMGVEPRIFSLSGQTQGDRLEWSRIARTLDLPDPATLYGRRVGFLEGHSIFLVMSGPRFYRADHDLTAAILRNDVDIASLIPLTTVRYPKHTLNLTDLPKEYARFHKLRVGGLGKIASGLETKIEHAVLEGTGSGRAPYRVLVKQGESGFWIRLTDEKLFEEMKKSRGKSLYVGLRFRHDPNVAEKLVNLPEDVFLRTPAETPRLFINQHSHLLSLPSAMVRPEDIWFLLVEFKDFQDARRQSDIRE